MLWQCRLRLCFRFDLPLIAAATASAFMIALGTHYLPFIFLYGMPQFGLLATLQIGAGLTIGLYMQLVFSVAAWLTALVLLLLAFIGRSVAPREIR
jgi:hypothetical protein